MHSEELRMITENAAQLDHYKNALDMVYEISSILDKYSTEEVLFYAAQILSELMDTEDVAIYNIVNPRYARLFSSTSQNARQLGNSIEYTAMEDMCSQLKCGQIFINKDTTSKLPSMAGAIYAEEEIQLILMFWGIPCQDLSPANANRLTVIITLIQNAMLRAKRYMSGFKRRNHMEGTGVLTAESFSDLVKTFFKAKSKGLTDCTLLEIVMGYEDYAKIAERLTGNIRQTDYMGIMEDEKLYILLANTDAEQAKVVQERIHKLGYSSHPRELSI